MTNFKTDPQLLEALKEAAGRKLTAAQMRAQKISFILGTLSEDSTITRENVEAELDRISGQAA